MVRRERAVDPPPTMIPTLRIADTAIGIHVKPARKFDAWRDVPFPARRDPLEGERADWQLDARPAS